MLLNTVVMRQWYAEVLKLLAATGTVTLAIREPGDTIHSTVAVMLLSEDSEFNFQPMREKGKSTMLLRIGRGQGMLEYALIIALVALVVVASLALLGPQIARVFQTVSNNL